jgi:ATP-dependent exoDNAse (exonuclease V) beta subunit
VPEGDGWHIVDYKTDQVGPDEVEWQLEYHRPQCELYREAIERITGQKVHSVSLVYLAARRIVTL